MLWQKQKNDANICSVKIKKILYLSRFHCKIYCYENDVFIAGEYFLGFVIFQFKSNDTYQEIRKNPSLNIHRLLEIPPSSVGVK